MLISHYQEIKNNLKAELITVKTIEEVVIVVQNEISSLASLDNEYIKQLTPPQARLAFTLLKGLRESISILLFVNLPYDKTDSVLNVSEVTSSNFSIRHIFNIGKLNPGQNLFALTSANYYKQVLLQPLQKNLLIVSSLFSAGFAGTLEGGLSWGLIGAIIGALTGGLFGKIIQEKDSNENENIVSQLEKVDEKSKLNIDIDKLLAYLHQAFQSIDISVSAYSNKEDKSSQSGLENNLDLLEYIQELMADTLNEKNPPPVNLRRKIEQAKTILRRYGIETRVYQPKQEEDTEKNTHRNVDQKKQLDDWLMFYFEPSLDPEVTEYITLKHALIKDKQVLLAGCVIEPVSVSKSKSQS